MMNGHGQSDGGVVSKKSPNNPKGAEETERRPPAEGNGRQGIPSSGHRAGERG